MNIEIHGNVIINNNDSGQLPEPAYFLNSLLDEDLDEWLDGECDCDECICDTEAKPWSVDAIQESNKILQREKKNLIEDYAEIINDNKESLSEIKNILRDFLDDYMDCF